ACLHASHYRPVVLASLATFLPDLPAPGLGLRLGSHSPRRRALRRLTVTADAANVGVSAFMGEIRAVWPICHLRMLTWAFAFSKSGQERHFLYSSLIRQRFYRTMRML